MGTLPPDFYDRPVLQVARDLIGCTVEYRGQSGVIVETEAYHQREPACHAYKGLTPRTATLFGPPGRAYVYRSYGIHALLNAVCEPQGIGAAVLIRALEPTVGVERMRARRGGTEHAAAGAQDVGAALGSPREPRQRDEELCSGPGKLTQAMGISLGENGADLSAGTIRILQRSEEWLDPAVVQGARIGITLAAELPWRFCSAGNRHVSRPRPLADRELWRRVG
jgi:DNA-3-methyladenine glycosylase